MEHFGPKKYWGQYEEPFLRRPGHEQSYKEI